MTYTKSTSIRFRFTVHGQEISLKPPPAVAVALAHHAVVNLMQKSVDGCVSTPRADMLALMPAAMVALKARARVEFTRCRR